MSDILTEQKIFESKWGFYPCSKETYLKLKKLNYWLLLSKQQAAKWNRWMRKKDYNRFIIKRINDKDGLCLRYDKVVVVIPEIKSPFCSLDRQKDEWTVGRYVDERTAQTFWCKKDNLERKFFNNGKSQIINGEQYGYRTGLYVDSFGIERNYGFAKTPQCSAEKVIPLDINEEFIDDLYDRASKVFD